MNAHVARVTAMSSAAPFRQRDAGVKLMVKHHESTQDLISYLNPCVTPLGARPMKPRAIIRTISYRFFTQDHKSVNKDLSGTIDNQDQGWNCHYPYCTSPLTTCWI